MFGVGLALVGAGLLLISNLDATSGWTALLAGFIVAGAGIGVTNPSLATTAVGVVEPQRSGMASGINNTFRQVGIATGIAGLGAIFQHKIHGTDRVAFVSAMNTILLVAAIVAFVGAIAGLALVRGRDFVRTQPQGAA
jgi:predicted MFS family arabinose efflux permease